MGCLNSKDSQGGVAERQRVPDEDEGAQQAGSAPISIGGRSEVRGNRALGGDVSLMSTSTEQRIREEEFFNRVLARTNANFINVSAPAFALEGQDPYDFSNDFSHCVSSATVDEGAVKLFSFPASACTSKTEAAELLGAPTISDAELERMDGIAAALLEAEQAMRIDDRGKPLVTDFAG